MKSLAPSFFDRAIASVAPSYGVRRYQARLALHMSGQYAGARSERAALRAWRTSPGSADSDSIGDLETLRSRSRDLGRNNPIAVGAKATSRSNVIGTGLKVRAQINREMLGLSAEQAEAWERSAEALFDIWASSTLSDITLTQNFYEQQGLLFDTVFESGDALVTRRKAKRSGGIVPLALGIAEADRIFTPPELASRDDIRAGVRIDEDGAPVSYIVSNDHPGEYMSPGLQAWKEVPAFGEKSGERMALHVYHRKRPGQTRGIPELAPVIEILKQFDRYTEAEIMSAVVSSYFTVFMKTADGNEGFAGATPPLPGMGRDEVTMGPGAVVNMGTDEDIQIANPARANSNFDPFTSSILRQIGVALSIPYELLIMHFTASYSASRAALEMAGQFFKERREWLINRFCRPVYEWFLLDAISTGLIAAPGFLVDPVKRAAWLGSIWVPPTRIVLDPVKEWTAETAAVALGAKTLEEVTLEKTGGDWKQKTEQRTREHAARVAGGLEPPILDPKAKDPTEGAPPPPVASGNGSDKEE